MVRQKEKQKLKEPEAQFSKQKEDMRNVQKFLKIVRKYTTLEQLSSSIVNELIDRIEIHKTDTNTDKRTQQIDIYYSFVGMIR